MKLPRIPESLRNAMPRVEWPTLGKTVEIPVYVIHNSRAVGDYFFIFDFAQFVEGSRSGLFVRPKLSVWAGRSDFDRESFARQFRISFAKEFDAARQALEAEPSTKDSGWFSWKIFDDLAAFSVSGFVANVVLLVATSAGRAIWEALPRPGFLRGKSDSSKLESSIADTQNKVDVALARMEIKVHRELWAHAFRDGDRIGADEIDEAAWPLPAFVRTHIADGVSTAWW